MPCVFFRGPLANRITVDLPESAETAAEAQPRAMAVLMTYEDGVVTRKSQEVTRREPAISAKSIPPAYW